MPVNSRMNWSDWKWCKTAVWPRLCSAVTFVRRSRKWLMFCATPLPAVIGIVLPGNRLRPFVDCFGSVVNLRWPCLLLFISWYLFTWGFKSRSLCLCQIIVMLIILRITLLSALLKPGFLYLRWPSHILPKHTILSIVWNLWAIF